MMKFRLDPEFMLYCWIFLQNFCLIANLLLCWCLNCFVLYMSLNKTIEELGRDGSFSAGKTPTMATTSPAYRHCHWRILFCKSTLVLLVLPLVVALRSLLVNFLVVNIFLKWLGLSFKCSRHKKRCELSRWFLFHVLHPNLIAHSLSSFDGIIKAMRTTVLLREFYSVSFWSTFTIFWYLTFPLYASFVTKGLFLQGVLHVL